MSYTTSDTIATYSLKVLRQGCLIPYLLIMAVFCAITTGGMCLWNQWIDEWNHNI